MASMKLTGDEVNVSRSLMRVTSVGDAGGGGRGSYTILTNYFIPDISIYDLYWAATNFSTTERLNRGPSGTAPRPRRRPFPETASPAFRSLLRWPTPTSPTWRDLADVTITNENGTAHDRALTPTDHQRGGLCRRPLNSSCKRASVRDKQLQQHRSVVDTPVDEPRHPPDRNITSPSKIHSPRNRARAS